jgi:uncharacterized protein
MKIADLETGTSSLLLQCISGSKAYGLDTPASDTDIKGVFILPKQEFYGLFYTEQLNNATNDVVYYELKRFFDLLLKNNPNILELLATPEDCVLHRHPLMDKIKVEDFLSRLCNQTFAGYAQSQVKKAKGLNKKIVNPVEEERKSILDFCYILNGGGSISLPSWLKKNNYEQEDCGLLNIHHMREIYALYHNSQLTSGFLSGICSGENANDVSLSSVPEGIQPLAHLSFNKDGYSSYCKDYREYWEWVQKRNDTRYSNTMEHGKNYDAKNMMHTFRLLNMAEEIAREGKIHVRRKDRDELLKIRSGFYEYEDLVNKVNEKTLLIDELFQHADLPTSPDMNKMNGLLVSLREAWYTGI